MEESDDKQNDDKYKNQIKILPLACEYFWVPSWTVLFENMIFFCDDSQMLLQTNFNRYMYSPTLTGRSKFDLRDLVKANLKKSRIYKEALLSE